MKQSHHIPPLRSPIEVVSPTLRRGPANGGWCMSNVLTCCAALLAVILSVSLSSAATDTVCRMPLDRMTTASCE